jgi:hypothetical protein
MSENPEQFRRYIRPVLDQILAAEARVERSGGR